MPHRHDDPRPASPPSPSSSVHPEETSVPGRLFPSYQSHLKSLHPQEFEAARETLEYLDPNGDGHALAALRTCRTNAWFVRNIHTGEVQVHSRHCRNRLCPFCNASKAAAVSSNVFRWIKTIDRPKLLTVTLKHSSAPLDQQVTALFALFRRWRQRRRLKASIHGGVWFLQVTLSPDDYSWHPHLHVILDADFIPQDVLARHWLNVTKTSRILDIREIRSPEKAASYVARYVARPGSIDTWPVDYRAEMYHCLGSRRSCGCFGSARTFKVLAKPAFTRSDWQTVGSWSAVHALAGTLAEAQQILTAWKLRRPLPPDVSVITIDHAIDWETGDQEPNPPPQVTKTFDFSRDTAVFD